MARHKSHQALPETNPALEIASLIDVCFLLLIYFIITSSIAPRESDLGMTLPAPSIHLDQTQPPIDSLLIHIGANGEISTGTEEGRVPLDSDPDVREMPLLRGHLETYAAASRAAGSVPFVKIDIADVASHQRWIDVLNTISATGIEAVTFSVSMP